MQRQMKNIRSILFMLILTLTCCEFENTPSSGQSSLYFPPLNSWEWDTISPGSLDWKTEYLDELFDHLSDNGTRAFIILKNGKIAVEEYFGKNILGTRPFNRETIWYWASAGKTITSFLVGIAQQENLLNINDMTSDYLGSGWTSMGKEKEDLITIRHQLTMTTGLDYTLSDNYCTEPSCLKYRKDAGEQWFYHNAPYTLLHDVISSASGFNINSYTDDKIESITGMSGEWIPSGYNNTYWSIPRDMARFGLLILNRGKWGENIIMSDSTYFNEMTSSSQQLNPSYGYLWWLNGKQSIILPGLALSFNTTLASNAPDDLIVAAGKNGQFLDVIPSLNIVVVRMGEAPDGSAVPIQFHNEMWEKINKIIIK